MYLETQVALLLLGNKTDLELYRQVPRKEAEEKSKLLSIKYMEISAKESTREEIKRLFLELIDQNEMSRFYVQKMEKSKCWKFPTGQICENGKCNLI